MTKRSREDFDTPPSIFTDSEDSSAETATTKPGISSDISAAFGTGSKIPHLEPSQATVVMRCSLPPHRETVSFATFEDYEIHHAKTHVNRCVECRRNFPTAHFLNLHQEENHDPLVAVLRERGERTYACFVEDCDRKCSTPQKRRMHLIDKHTFPKDYDFYIVNNGIDQRSSMLMSGRHRRKSSATKIDKTRRRSSIMASPSKSVGIDEDTGRGFSGDTGDKIVENGSSSHNGTVQEVDIEGLSGAMSALKFVPPSIRFGRGGNRGRAGLSRS